MTSIPTGNSFRSFAVVFDSNASIILSRVDLKNTIIIMTSNLGARFIEKRGHLGFSALMGEGIPSKIEDMVRAEVKRAFNPEFLNRLDHIIPFTSLTDDDLLKIIDLMVNAININLETKQLKIRLMPDAAKSRSTPMVSPNRSNEAEEEFGNQRLIAAQRRYREQTAGGMVASIVDEVRRFSPMNSTTTSPRSEPGAGTAKPPLSRATESRTPCIPR
jgi:hypothetical protein